MPEPELKDSIEDLLLAAPPRRRLAWGLGRRLYCAAREETWPNAIATNGEANLQRWVVQALPPAVTPLICDIGAYVGDWSLSLLDAMHAAGRVDARIFAFEPVPTAPMWFEAALAPHPLARLVETQACAVSDSCDKAKIAILGELGGVNTLSAETTAPPLDRGGDGRPLLLARAEGLAAPPPRQGRRRRA
jgi:hypothetical protein